MIHAKDYEKLSKFVKVMAKILSTMQYCFMNDMYECVFLRKVMKWIGRISHV